MMYRSRGPQPLGAEIDASAFGLVGWTLPTVRSVIIAHEQNGVISYQVRTLTFDNPS